MHTVWFNKGLSQTGLLIRALKACFHPGEQFRIICTHHVSTVQAAAEADLFELEPAEWQSPADYVEWALDFVRRHNVDVLLAHNYAATLSGARLRFKNAGCQLITAGSAETIALLKSKTALYNKVTEAGGLGILLPECVVATSPEEVAGALVDLRLKHPTACFKPSIDLGGRGFRIVSDQGADYPQPYNGDAFPMTLSEALAYLNTIEAPFPEMMVMPYLNGPEHSLDCLAKGGVLVRAVPRSKSQGGIYEIIEDQPDLVEQTSALTKVLGLDGLYNVQFLESETGERYLLEINARMAGGTYFGSYVGIVLPYWAIRLALGTATIDDVPPLGARVKVDRKTLAVIDD